MGTLYIIATPIGNLKDITLRALETLKSVDLILAEDTRVTKKLLSHYNIEIPVTSYHQHSTRKKIEEILNRLRSGKDIALVSDAGTPGISDPGNELIEAVLHRHGEEGKIVPIPGPSALSAAASIAGISMDKFLFLGYPPAKKKRMKFFREVAHSIHPVIFFESPHRIVKSLRELGKEANEGRRVIVCKELTKVFEGAYRGAVLNIADELEERGPRGEYTVIVEPENKKALSVLDAKSL